MLKADAEIPVNDEVTLKRFAHDVDGIKFKTIQSNRDHLLPWLPWVDNIYFPTQVRLFTENQIKEFNHGRIFGYNIFFNNIFVGSAVIYDVSERNHNCKLGYWLDKLYRGRGIATQCATTLIDYALIDYCTKVITPEEKGKIFNHYEELISILSISSGKISLKIFFLLIALKIIYYMF